MKERKKTFNHIFTVRRLRLQRNWTKREREGGRGRFDNIASEIDMQRQEKAHKLAYQQNSERGIIRSERAQLTFFSLISLSTDCLTANDRILDIFLRAIGRSIGVCHNRGRNRARGYYRDPAQKLRRSTLA